jgi:hypothetical protein
MRHRLIVMLVVLMALFLAACAPAGTSIPVPTQPPANNATAQATSAPQVKATEPAAAANTPEAAAPAATPDIEKVTKPQPDDWKRGPDGAKVTIIEWGDFQ